MAKPKIKSIPKGVFSGIAKTVTGAYDQLDRIRVGQNPVSKWENVSLGDVASTIRLEKYFMDENPWDFPNDPSHLTPEEIYQLWEDIVAEIEYRLVFPVKVSDWVRAVEHNIE